MGCLCIRGSVLVAERMHACNSSKCFRPWPTNCMKAQRTCSNRRGRKTAKYSASTFVIDIGFELDEENNDTKKDNDDEEDEEEALATTAFADESLVEIAASF